MSRVDASLARAVQAVTQVSEIAAGEGDFDTIRAATAALAALEVARVQRAPKDVVK